MENNITKKVLEYLKTIPKGKVTTYSAIAEKFTTHPRAIATIMRTNKQPEVYPCYKVVSVSGELLNYSVGGVLEKRRLLEREGIRFIGDKVCEEYIL